MRPRVGTGDSCDGERGLVPSRVRRVGPAAWSLGRLSPTITLALNSNRMLEVKDGPFTGLDLLKDLRGSYFSLSPCWSVAHALAESHVDVSSCTSTPGDQAEALGKG